MKIATVVGARPQFVKAAVVSRALRSRADIQEVLIHTGQHYDIEMSDIFFAELEIPEPAYNLNVGSGRHGAQTGQMLARLEGVLLQEQPDLVLVYGDTNTTLAGALAAAKLNIPVGHIEAGLRSFNRSMPEEINRVLTDHISVMLFAPTDTALENLRREGIAENQLFLSGDVMYDAALYYGAKAERRSKILTRTRVLPQQYLLATIHRAENTDSKARLQTISNALMELSSEIPIVVPLHPRTRLALERAGILEVTGTRLQILEPLGYLDMILLEKNARAIVTDSGGVQKEAFFYGVPCVTLRDETEWIELVACGWNKVVSPAKGAAAISEGVRDSLTLDKPPRPNLYGEGNAAERILAVLEAASFDRQPKVYRGV